MPQKQVVQKPEDTSRVQAGIGHSDHGHSSGPREEHHGRLTTITWNEEAVTATTTLVDLRGTAVAQRGGSLPCHRRPGCAIIQQCRRDTEQATRETTSIWGRLCRRLLEEYALGSPRIYRHSLGARAARRAGRGTAVGTASSGNAVIKPTSISMDEQLRLMRQRWERSVSPWAPCHSGTGILDRPSCKRNLGKPALHAHQAPSCHSFTTLAR